MARWCERVLLPAALVLFPATASNVGAQTVSPYAITPSSFGDIRFTLDVTVLPTVRGGSTVEIGCSVVYDELMFLKRGDGYRARYEITAILYDSRGRQVAGDSWVRSVDVETYVGTNSRKSAARDVLRIDAKEGSYRLKVELSSLDSRRSGVVERRVEVGALAEGLVALGTVEFDVAAPSLSPDVLRFVPNPSRQYEEERPVVRVQVPAYGDSGITYALELSVTTLDNRTRMTMRDTVLQTAWVTRHVRQFSVVDLEVGDYLLHVRALPSGGGERHTESRFRVLTSPRSWGDDFEKMIAQIGYVATRDEISRLTSASPDERDEAWDVFWKDRDPNPTTDRNEFKEEFLQRLGYANTRFTSLIEGWQTVHAWETWYYYGEHKRFTFVDRQGFGDYRLVEVTRI
jgi:GWxTD domain-containing protein